MSREKTRLFCPGTSDLNWTGKGLTYKQACLHTFPYSLTRNLYHVKIFQFDVLYKSLKMHAELFALQCFMEWVLKKVQNSGKLHMTLHTLRLHSLQYRRTPYMCVFSFYAHATEALLLARLQKLMPTETCHLPHVTISTAGKNNEI